MAATPANTLIVVQGLDDIVSLDPAESNELSSIQTVPSLYQRIVQPNRDNPEINEPILVESWQAHPEQKSIVFKIKQDAKFASGNSVRPEDIIFSYQRAVTMNKSPAFILNVLGWKADNINTLLKKSVIRRLKYVGQQMLALMWYLTSFLPTPIRFYC